MALHLPHAPLFHQACPAMQSVFSSGPCGERVIPLVGGQT